MEAADAAPKSPTASTKRIAEGSPEKEIEDVDLYTDADTVREESGSLTSSSSSSRKKSRSSLSSAELAILKAAEKRAKIKAIFKDKEEGLNDDIINVFRRMEAHQVLQLSTLIPDVLPSATDFDLNILSQVLHRFSRCACYRQHSKDIATPYLPFADCP